MHKLSITSYMVLHWVLPSSFLIKSKSLSKNQDATSMEISLEAFSGSFETEDEVLLDASVELNYVRLKNAA